MATKKPKQEAEIQDIVEEAAEELEAKPEEIVKGNALEEVVRSKDEEIARLKAQLQAQMAKARPNRAGRESDYDRIHRIERETDANGVDPWTVEVEVLVPHREKTEDPWYWINVNGRSVQIPANDRLTVMKLPFACVLVDQLYYERRSADYQDSLEVFDPETNPHK